MPQIINKPESLLVAPTPPVTPSDDYITGYHDGYAGDWLGPIKWISEADYRAGWQAGDYDRTHNNPSKYKART